MDTLSILKIIKGIFAVLDLFVWARVILSWVPHNQYNEITRTAVSYTHLRAHETSLHLVCRLLLEKKNH